MPIRHTSPSLGGFGDQYMKAGSRRITLSYRRLTADEWVVGHDVRNESGPGGRPLEIDIHSFDLNLALAVSARFTLALNLPYSTGTLGRIYPDGEWHEASAAGLSDANVTGTYWLWAPAGNPRGNLALTLGVKAGTGTNDAEDDLFLANGTSVSFPVDDTLQPGDGSWGIIVQFHGFRKLTGNVFAYGSGSYTINPRVIRDEVRQPAGPLASEHFAVPDVFGLRAGVATAAAPNLGVSASLGVRFDGTTRRDLIGGRDDGFRRPAVVGYLDPGVALVRGNHAVTASVPLRIYKNFRRSYLDEQKGRPGGGDLARRLLLLSYARTF